jgi:hypothetical protein
MLVVCVIAAELATLRQKFEEAQKQIEKMKAQRKFKPF